MSERAEMEQLVVNTTRELRRVSELKQHELAEYLSACLARVGIVITDKLREKLYDFSEDNFQ